MSPRPNRRAERIDQIMQAAMVIFAQRGFAQARMEDIALEAGLSKAALYLYFPSKDDVIAALLQAYFAHGFEELVALREQDEPVRSSLIAWSLRRGQELQADAAYLGIGYEFFAIAARQESVRKSLQQFYREYRTEIAALIDKGVAHGELHILNSDEIAVALIAMFEGLTMMWMLDPDAVNLVTITERAIHMLLNGLTADGKVSSQHKESM